MADDENLSIRISELPETNSVSGSDDYLAVIKPSTLYTSGYKSFKVKASKLPGGGGGASSAEDVSYEQIVGTWVDGSTLYEKTIYNDNFY